MMVRVELPLDMHVLQCSIIFIVSVLTSVGT